MVIAMSGISKNTVREAKESKAGNGLDEETIIAKNSEGKEQCPFCREWYSQVSNHWTKSSMCDHPPITYRKVQIIKGLVLGDGSLNYQSKNIGVVITNTNLTFMEWLKTEMGWLVGRLEKMKNVAQGFDVDPDYHMYQMSTRKHPQFSPFVSWYDDDEGFTFPQNISLSPMLLKMWYVSDGSLQHSGNSDMASVKISINHDSDVRERVKKAFREVSFDVSSRSNQEFALGIEDSQRFLNFIGDPVPGYEYKWENRDYDRYRVLLDEKGKHKTKISD
jgi:hypothetical protein